MLYVEWRPARHRWTFRKGLEMASRADAMSVAGKTAKRWPGNVALGSFLTAALRKQNPGQLAENKHRRSSLTATKAGFSEEKAEGSARARFSAITAICDNLRQRCDFSKS
jgi:hypothetical protein